MLSTIPTIWRLFISLIILSPVAYIIYQLLISFKTGIYRGSSISETLHADLPAEQVANSIFNISLVRTLLGWCIRLEIFLYGALFSICFIIAAINIWENDEARYLDIPLRIGVMGCMFMYYYITTKPDFSTFTVRLFLIFLFFIPFSIGALIVEKKYQTAIVCTAVFVALYTVYCLFQKKLVVNFGKRILTMIADDEDKANFLVRQARKIKEEKNKTAENEK